MDFFTFFKKLVSLSSCCYKKLISFPGFTLSFLNLLESYNISFNRLIRDHMLVCDHKVLHEDFKFLGNEPNKYLLELKESLFIKRDRPSLNKNLYSQELLLF